MINVEFQIQQMLQCCKRKSQKLLELAQTFARFMKHANTYFCRSHYLEKMKAANGEKTKNKDKHAPNIAATCAFK